MAKIDGGELIVRTLMKAGVKIVFSLHGGHLEPIYQASFGKDFEILDVRHEAAAGHAAEGYTRTTGLPSVAAVTAGPGFTNVLTSIASAWLDCMPVLYIAGSPPLRDVEHNVLQGGFDQVRMAEPITKWSHKVTQVHQIPQIVAQALRIATSGRPGPVFLDFPSDVIYDTIDEDVAFFPDTITVENATAPTDSQVKEALELLSGAKNPVIMAGGGAWLSGSGPELLRFAEATGIPVYANSRGQGLIPGDHPLFGGTFPNMARIRARTGEDPDVVMLLGARLGMFTAGITGRVVPTDAKIIHIDIEAKEIGRMRDATVGINADCKGTLIQFNKTLEKYTWPDRSSWSQAAHDASVSHREEFADAMARAEAPIHPYQVVATVADMLDDDTIIVADGGEAFDWMELVSRPKQGGSLLSAGYLGCLGTGFAWAIGAKKAHPDRPVVCVTGDGAAGFNIQEFETMVRHKIPVVVIILNNESWGMSLHAQDVMFGRNRTIITDIGQVNYHDVIAGFGAYTEEVREPADIAAAVKRAFESGKPACLNIVTDKWAVSPFTLNLLGERKDEREIMLPYYENLNR